MRIRNIFINVHNILTFRKFKSNNEIQKSCTINFSRMSSKITLNLLYLKLYSLLQQIIFFTLEYII